MSRDFDAINADDYSATPMTTALEKADGSREHQTPIGVVAYACWFCSVIQEKGGGPCPIHGLVVKKGKKDERRRP